MVISISSPKEMKHALRKMEEVITIQGVLAKGLHPLADHPSVKPFAFASAVALGTMLILGVPTMFVISRDYLISIKSKEEVILKRKKPISK